MKWPLSLLLAALLTLLSSWLCALLASTTTGQLHAVYDDTLLSEHPPVPADWRIHSWHHRAGPGIRYDLVSECEWHGSRLLMRLDNRPQRTRTIITVGWPIPAMQYRDCSVDRDDLSLGPFERASRSGLRLPKSLSWRDSIHRRLPLMPTFPAFAFATLLYIPIAALPIFGLPALRRRRRRRHNRCTSCAYPLGGASTCPECGLALPRSRAQSPASITQNA